MNPPSGSPSAPSGARWRRIPPWSVTAAVVVALLSGAAALAMYAIQSESAVEAHLASGLGRAQQAVATWEVDELARVKSWAGDPSLRGAETSIPAPLVAFARTAVATEGIRAIALFSPQGALLSSTAPQLLTDPMLGQRVAAVQRARAGTASVAGPIWPTSSRDGGEASEWLMISAAPVRDGAGQTTAVLAILYSSDAPLARLRLAMRVDARAETYLMDARGRVLTSVGPEGDAGASRPSATAEALDAPAARADSGLTLRAYRGVLGRRVVGAWGSVEPLAARAVYELTSNGAAWTQALPVEAGVGLAALLAIAALLVVLQHRGVVRLRADVRARQNELAVVVESAPNAVLVADERGVVTRANKKAVHLLDAPSSLLVGSSLERWLKTSTAFRDDRVADWLDAAASAAKGRRADGDEVPVEVRVGTGESDGHRIFIVVLMDGVTQRGAERALRSAKEEAQRARKGQTEFLSAMTQEIRTPMSRVMGMAHLLKDTSLSPVQQGYVESLMRSANLMMTFVTDVLDLSKIEAGSLQLIEAPFDLRVAVEEVAELCEPQASANSTRVEVAISARTPLMVVGDAGRFRQVLINLMGNGIKFSPHGQVEVRLDGVLDGTDVALKVKVSDNGPGMDPETVRRLFTKDDTTVSKLVGGGLGVSIAKHLVELMRGKLEVNSLQGEGSTFSFSIPFRTVQGAGTAGTAGRAGTVGAAGTAGTAGTAEAPPAMRLAGARALVVGASSSELKVTREWLRSFGMRVETTTTPEEAIGHLRRAAAEGDPVEVALVDRQSLGEQGEAFARRLRSEPAIAGTGLLIATDNALAADAERLGAAGCDAVLAKPFGAQALSRTLAAVVQRPREERGRGPVIRGDTISAPIARPAVEWVDGQIPIVEEPSGRRGSAPEPVADTRLRVLLAEDNRVNQIVATNLLQRLGCRVEVVSDGAEAVRVAARYRFDVIFMDIQMPHLDGCAATELIRRLPPPNNGAHIIALGTSASPEEHDRYLAAGMNDVVLKPITPETIQSALERRPAGLERVSV